jgi:hypothetical protein
MTTAAVRRPSAAAVRLGVGVGSRTCRRPVEDLRVDLTISEARSTHRVVPLNRRGGVDGGKGRQ